MLIFFFVKFSVKKFISASSNSEIQKISKAMLI